MKREESLKNKIDKLDIQYFNAGDVIGNENING